MPVSCLYAATQILANDKGNKSLSEMRTISCMFFSVPADGGLRLLDAALICFMVAGTSPSPTRSIKGVPQAPFNGKSVNCSSPHPQLIKQHIALGHDMDQSEIEHDGITYTLLGRIVLGSRSRIMVASTGYGETVAVKIVHKHRAYDLFPDREDIASTKSVMEYITVSEEPRPFLLKLLHSWDDNDNIYFVMVRDTFISNRPLLLITTSASISLRSHRCYAQRCFT